MSIGDFFNLIKLLWQKRALLLQLLEVLPDTLHTVGLSMELAGDGSIAVAKLLRGGSGVPVNARDSVHASAQVIQQAGNQIGQVAGLLEDIDSLLRDVEVPVLDIKKNTFDIPVVGSVRLVTGVDIEDAKPFAPVANLFDSAHDDLIAVKQNLSNTANQLEALSGVFLQTGNNLNTMGDQLKLGGQSLKAFAE